MRITLLNKSPVLYILEWSLQFYKLLNMFSSWLAISCSENLFLDTHLKEGSQFYFNTEDIRVAVAEQYQTFTLFSNKMQSQAHTSAQQAWEILAVLWEVHTYTLLWYWTRTFETPVSSL